MSNENVKGIRLLDTIFDEVSTNLDKGFVVIRDDTMVTQGLEITD